jgi:response regulator of citrate/malate metabolism
VIRVLVVDDDFMVARVHRRYVEKVPGFTVVGEAHTGAAALEAVDALAPDLVLLDVYLPDVSGIDVLTRLRESGRPGVDVLPVTAARDAETVRAAMRGGVVHYLLKPFTFDALRERLERYGEARRRLDGAGETSQDDVDRVYGALRGGETGPRMPKGLSRATFTLVADTLRDADASLSAQEVADGTGLSRVTARRYLEHLCETGRATLRPRYGTAGRPEHGYVWAG